MAVTECGSGFELVSLEKRKQNRRLFLTKKNWVHQNDNAQKKTFGKNCSKLLMSPFGEDHRT